MTTTQKACAWARAIANDNAHGYDQTGRWGPDYDCSSLVITAFREAGVPLACTYTGNMRGDMLANGFRDVTALIDLTTGAGLRAGDVLLHETKHTAVCLGNGQIVNAGGNELGAVTGGKTGDQTGMEIRVMSYYNLPWQYVLRYTEKDNDTSSGAAAPHSPQGEGQTGTYTVKHGDSLWGIAERIWGDGSRYEEIQQSNGLDGIVIYPGQILRIPVKSVGRDKDIDPFISITVSVRESTLLQWRTEAAIENMTIGEYLDCII